MGVKSADQVTISFIVDVKAVYRYYKLQSSTLSTPDAPTSYPPVGWTDEEPNHTSGSTQTLYTTDCTVFTDDSFVYSKVSKTSSYEAAKEAYNKAQDASKTATNYMDFSEANGLVIGDMTGETLGKNIKIVSNGVIIRDGETVLASFTDDGLDIEKPVVFSADGIMLNNGDAFTRLGQNQILWQGAYHMNDSQNINLNANITRQLSGAVFVWSYYDGVSALDHDFTYFFVPKSHIEKSPGDGIRMSDPYLGMMKHLYVNNGIVSGHANNDSSGTTNGIAWDNKNYVLRYVIGV